MHAICVSHHRAATGGIGIGLKHLDSLRHDAVSADCRRVILDLRTRSVAQYPLVPEGEMTDVQEVLDNARPACLYAVWPRHQHAIRRIVEQLESWDLASPAAEAHPYDPMSRGRVKCGHLCLCRRSLLRVGGHEHAAPVRGVCPTVIRALEPHAVDNAAKRQSCASMHAEIAPGEELATGTPDDEVL